MSARNYHYLQRNNPEQHSSQLLRSRGLKSLKVRATWKESKFKINSQIFIVKPTRCTNVSNLPASIHASKQSAVSAWHMPVAVRTVLNSWWWVETPSETCRVCFFFFFRRWTSLMIESYGLLNDIFPFPSILDAGYPIFNPHLANVLFDAVLPSVLGSSSWSFG